MKLTLTHSVTYNDAIYLTSRWKVRFRHTFFSNEAQKVLYKPVLVSDLISYFWWSYSLSNFRKKFEQTIFYCPISISMELCWNELQATFKTNICRFTGFTKMRLTLLLGGRSVQYNRVRQTFFQNKVQRVLYYYKLVLVTYPLDHSRRIYSPSNCRFIQNVIKCVPL